MANDALMTIAGIPTVCCFVCRFRIDMKGEAVLETMVQQCGKVGKTRFFYVDSTRARNGTVS